MFKSDMKPEKFKEVETIIGPSIKVKGNFNGKGNVVVEGVLEGSLKTDGDVFVGEKAQISADIFANEGIVGGRVIGNIIINASLEVMKTAIITGNIKCTKLSVEPGAIINGSCEMTGSEKTLKVEKKTE